MPLVAGIDGCKKGWIAVVHDPATGVARVHAVRTLVEFLTLEPALDVVAIDMPMGLPERSAPYGRECEKLAQERLGKFRGSIFPTPARAAVWADSRTAATDINRALGGQAVSIYSYGLFAKIRELDALLRLQPALIGTFHEVHPESCFAYHAKGPLVHGKKTHEGQTIRRTLIGEHFGQHLESAEERTLPGVAKDDLLDAFIACVTSQRIAAGNAECLPVDPPVDRFGIPMAIWV